MRYEIYSRFLKKTYNSMFVVKHTVYRKASVRDSMTGTQYADKNVAVRVKTMAC